jgi:hypothetical protein
MEVSYDEDLANHIGPESCVHVRKEVREALTGESAGWVLSREKGCSSGCRRRQRARKATRNTSQSQEVFWPRVVVDPTHAWKLSAREPGDPVFGLDRMATRSAQKIPREQDCDERTWEVGQANSTEEAVEQRRVRLLPAEAVEERGLTEGNPFWQNKLRALNRERGEDGNL